MDFPCSPAASESLGRAVVYPERFPRGDLMRVAFFFCSPHLPVPGTYPFLIVFFFSINKEHEIYCRRTSSKTDDNSKVSTSGSNEEVIKRLSAKCRNSCEN